jgi:pilus assembly protein CpaE
MAEEPQEEQEFLEEDVAETPAEAQPQGAFGAAAHERPVPRISIQAFCEFPDTGAALSRAVADRRLAKAHVTVQLGGVNQAVSYFAEHPTPNLLIVETRSQGAAVLGELDRLARVCDETTKVLVVGRVNDVQLYRELVRRGVSEYMVAPLNPLHLIETISSLYVNPDAPPIGRIVAFVGTRGGAGSSTIAHNVAWHIAEGLKISTALVDFDLPYGTAGLNFNQDPGQGVADALAAPERLDDMLLDRLLIKQTEHLSLFAAPALLDRDYEADASAYESVIDQVRSTTPCVVLDLPHIWRPWVKQTLFGSDDIVIVATPDLASLRNAKNMIDLLKTQRANDAPPRLVLNQVGVHKRPEIPAKDFSDALGLPPAVVVPFDPQLFGTAANNGQMLAEVQPQAKAAEAMRHLAEFVTGRAIAPAAKKSSIKLMNFLPKRKAS